MKKTLSIQLSETKMDKNAKREPLGELILETLKVINGGKVKPYPPRAFAWLVAYATRVVCEAIIRDGFMAVPMKVEQTDAEYWHLTLAAGGGLGGLKIGKIWCKRVEGFRFKASRN
jgi:hypothetical protein